MGDPIDRFTKRKAPNAYVLFATHMARQYRVNHPELAHRFQELPKAISDPLIVEMWEGLSPDDKQQWKDRAREEKHRLVVEYSNCIEQYVAGMTIGRNEPADSASVADGDGASSVGAFGGSANMETASTISTRVPPAGLRRLIRPQKKRRGIEESKYAPAFFDEISTAKQFDEKRRRERECVTQVWFWRYGDHKAGLYDETFFLISSQPFGVTDDQHAPGMIACVEFSIRDGIKREFCCSVAEDTTDWIDRASFDLDVAVDCGYRLPPTLVSRRLFGDWLRSKQADLSSKTPVFFCLADEYHETFDCLSLLYNFKENSSNTRFPTYSLATTDDLFWALLHFFDVPMTSEVSTVDGHQQASTSRPQVESFALSRVIDQYFAELAKVHACESHLGLISDGDGNEVVIGNGDGCTIDKNQRCPLAVVRACATYAKIWVENGRMDDQTLQASTPPETPEKKETEGTSVTESLKEEDMDRFSYLALSVSGAASDRTIGSGGSERGIAEGHRHRESDSSDDVIEIKPEKLTAAQVLQQRYGGTAKQQEPQADQTSASAHPSLVQSTTAAEASSQSWSCASSRGSTVKRFPLQQVPAATVPKAAATTASVTVIPEYEEPIEVNPPPTVVRHVPMNGAVSSPQVISSLWTSKFRALYEAQLRMPKGCRGLGRGIVFGNTAANSRF